MMLSQSVLIALVVLIYYLDSVSSFTYAYVGYRKRSDLDSLSAVRTDHVKLCGSREVSVKGILLDVGGEKNASVLHDLKRSLVHAM